MRVLLISFLSLLAVFSFSQKRYLDPVFDSVKVTKDQQYAVNYSIYTGTYELDTLLLDVYEPLNDTASARPLVILAHGGAMLPKGVNTLPHGDKEDSCLVEICRLLARHGYVAASIDYRLGYNPFSWDQDIRNGTAFRSTFRAAQDMKSAIRWFKLSGQQSLYMIDTNAIVIGGSSHGALISLQCAYQNRQSELQKLSFSNSVTGMPYVQTDTLGDWEGKGGVAGINIYNNPGPSSKINMVLSLGGGIWDSTWIEQDDIPALLFHGVEDAIIDYGQPWSPSPTPINDLKPFGSKVIAQYWTNLGNDAFQTELVNDTLVNIVSSKTNLKNLFPFEGLTNGYEPWGWYNPNDPNIDTTGTGWGSKANPVATPMKARAYIDTIIGYFAGIAAAELGLVETDSSTNIVQHESNTSLKMYPNPSTNYLNIIYPFERNRPLLIEIFNSAGLLQFREYITSADREIRLEHELPYGLYYISIDKGIASGKFIVMQ